MSDPSLEGPGVLAGLLDGEEPVGAVGEPVGPRDPARSPGAEDEPSGSPDPAVSPGTEAGPAEDAPPAPSPLGVDLASTGNAEVDAFVDRLADADELPTQDHIEVYEDVHAGLREVLAALDKPVGPRPPQPQAEPQNRS
jgi:hypothetical protein